MFRKWLMWLFAAVSACAFAAFFLGLCADLLLAAGVPAFAWARSVLMLGLAVLLVGGSVLYVQAWGLGRAGAKRHLEGQDDPYAATDIERAAKGGQFQLLTILIAGLVVLGAMHYFVGERQAGRMLDAGSRLGSDGASLFFMGAVGPQLDEAIKGALRGSEKRLVLGDSGGGSVFGGLHAAEELKRAGIESVVINGYCQSSCAVLAMLPKTRVSTLRGRLGFHAVRSRAGETGGTMAKFASWAARNALGQAGHRGELVDLMLSGESIRTVGPVEAQRLGLIAGCVGEDFQTPIPCTNQGF